MPRRSGSFAMLNSLLQRGHQLVGDDARVPVVERVVLGRTVGRPIAPLLWRRLRLFGRAPRVDEHRQHHRDLAAIDQVVEHRRRAEIAFDRVLERLPVVEDHQARRHRRVVLRRHVHPVGVLRARVRLARQRERATNLALRDAFPREGIRPELIVRVGIRRVPEPEPAAKPELSRSLWPRRDRRGADHGHEDEGLQPERDSLCHGAQPSTDLSSHSLLR